MDFRLLYTFHTHASIFIEQIYYSYCRALNATTVNSGNRFIYSCSLGGESTLKTLTTAHQLCLHLDCYTKVHSPEFTVKQGEIGKLLEYKSWSLWGLSSHKKKALFKIGVANTESHCSEFGLNCSLKAWRCKVFNVSASILFLPNENQKGNWQWLYFLLESLFFFKFSLLNTGPIWGLYYVYKQEHNFGSWILIS